MSIAYTEHYTSADYADWEGDWELIRGAPYAMSPSPNATHQLVSGWILSQLNERLQECPQCQALMEMDWNVSSDTVVRPDVMVACYDLGERVTRTPDMIFEVVSPRTAQRDEQTKFELYEQEGVAWYTLLYPDQRKAKVFRRIRGRLEKSGDFSTETFVYALDACEITFRFDDIWRQPSHEARIDG